MTTESRPIPTAPAPAMPAEVPAWRLLATLAFAGAAAGLLIVLAYIWTRPPIERHRANALRAAIEEVLRSPARADTLYMVNGAIATQPPEDAKPGSVERIYRGYDNEGRLAGYALVATQAGFADNIVVMFGWSFASGELLGIRVLSSKETPGLGDKIEKAPFTGQFPGALVPLRGVKDAASKGGGDDRDAIIMVTGATISSRTVIKGINNAMERWKPLIADFESRRVASGGGAL